MVFEVIYKLHESISGVRIRQSDVFHLPASCVLAAIAAADWRSGCWDVHTEEKKLNKLEAGMRIR